MSSKQEWLVILPDKPGMLSERMKVRPQHLEGVKSLESKFWLLGGATLDEPIKEGEGPKINGSVMLGQADTKEEILEQLRQDVYMKNGVWDESKIQIMPFRSAIRSAL